MTLRRMCSAFILIALIFGSLFVVQLKSLLYLIVFIIALFAVI